MTDSTTDNDAYPPRIDDLVCEVREFANRQARPRLTGEQVRQQGLRRRRTRRSATTAGAGILAVAGAAIVALLAAGHGSATVAPPAGHPPTSTSTPAVRQIKPTPTAARARGTESASAVPWLSSGGQAVPVKASATSVADPG